MEENIEDKMAKIVCKTDIERLATIFTNQQLRVFEKIISTLKVFVYTQMAVIIAIILTIIYLK